RGAVEGEVGLEGGAGDEAAEYGRGDDADGADERRLGDASGADAVHPEANEEGDGDGAGDGERAPGAAGDNLLCLLGQGDLLMVVGGEGARLVADPDLKRLGPVDVAIGAGEVQLRVLREVVVAVVVGLLD